MKQQRFWAIAIPILLILSIWTIVGRRGNHLINQPRLGLDISGGVRAILRAHPEKVPGIEYDGEAVRRILENRVNSSGVGDASVTRKGEYDFIVELPDVLNKNAVLEQLGTTAQMTFYYFKGVATRQQPNLPIIPTAFHDASGAHCSFLDRRTQTSFRDGAAIRNDYTQLLKSVNSAATGVTSYTVMPPLSDTAAGTALMLTPAQIAKVRGLEAELGRWQAFLAQCPVILKGNDVLPKCDAYLDSTNNQPAVSQEFDAAGTQKFGEFTSKHVGEDNGIVLDDAVISAPEIDSAILDGNAEISGGFATLGEAKALASLLNAGALPVPLEQVEVTSIAAGLGAQAVHKSIIAGAVGLALVLIFMLLYYRLPGLVADVALMIYGVFVYAIFVGGLKWLFPGLAVTFTLPGIVGFILSIGMAVDANILIFERLKEELRSGKSLRASIDAGFKRAFTAIRDSNICTCITCIVLISLGEPSVKGFALTLLIGVLVSLFSAITVTRTLLYALVNAGVGTNPAWFGLNVRSGAEVRTGDATHKGTAGWNIIGNRKWFYVLSLAIIVPGLIFWLGIHPSGLKEGIQFTGGTQLEVKFQHPVAQSELEQALKSNGFSDAIVQMGSGSDQTSVVVSTPQTSPIQNENNNPVHAGLMRAVMAVGPGATEVSFGKVAGDISKELQLGAVQAVVIAALLIVLYLALVFSGGGFVSGMRFGVSAIIALVHDVLVLIGLFAILGFFRGWKIDYLFITALLTVIGFSVHDTVVIFDRVRENRALGNRNDPFEPLVNRSIQQSLARSVNTSVTVLMTLAALIIFGGETTRLLNVALFIGILSGTYSSIFNAASILVDWENWLAKRRASSPPRPSIGGPGNLVTATPVGSGQLTRTDESGAGVGADGRLRPKHKRPARRF